MPQVDFYMVAVEVAHAGDIREIGRWRNKGEKYISPGEKVELLALIGEFVFTIGLGFSPDRVARV